MNLKLEAEERALDIAPLCVEEKAPPSPRGERAGVRWPSFPSPPSPPTVPLAHRMGEGSGVRAILRSAIRNPHFNTRLVQFTKFCVVGGSGVFVDMGILYLLADPSRLGWNITLSKVVAAEIAMINNFVWNELWTFRQSPSSPAVPLAHRMGEGPGVRAMESGERAGVRSRLSIRHSKFAIRNSVFLRFLLFNAICGIGIGLAVLLLHLFHTWFGWNLYLSNLLAIILVTLWNYGMNAWWNWRRAL